MKWPSVVSVDYGPAEGRMFDHFLAVRGERLRFFGIAWGELGFFFVRRYAAKAARASGSQEGTPDPRSTGGRP